MVAGSAPRAARRDHRLALHVAVGVRRLARPPRRSRTRRLDRRKRPMPSARATPTGSTTGSRYGGTLDDQVRFEREWQALRAYAARARRAHLRRHADLRRPGRRRPPRAPQLFQRGAPSPGVPPDSFAKTGQLWGNPLYDWTAMRADGYRWWIERFRRTFELVDLTRVDHFRGFVSYWAVPAGNTTAAHGRWRRGPGADLFHAIEHELGALARRRRGPRRDHRARRAPAARARLPRHGRPAVRARPRPDEPAPARRTTTSSRSSTPARTTTTRRAAGGSRCRRPTAPGRSSTLPTRRGR